MWGLAYSKDGNQLYATGSTGGKGKVVVMSVGADGTPAIQKLILFQLQLLAEISTRSIWRLDLKVSF